MKKSPKRRKANASDRKKKDGFFIRYRLIIFPLACFVLGIVAGVFDLITTRHFCANSISCINDLSGTYKSATAAVYMGQNVAVPPFIAEAIHPAEEVLGASILNKHIYIDLTNQRLMAFEGNTMIYNFTVATGWWHRTPTGDFSIWTKLRYARMTGGSGADYYDLPNIPFVMYFSNSEHPEYEGYGIHDAYWLSETDFGHPRSHGCINLRYADAQNLYSWAMPIIEGYTTYATSSNPGTPVTIYGTTPDHYW